MQPISKMVHVLLLDFLWQSNMFFKTRRDFLKRTAFSTSAVFIPSTTLIASTKVLDTLELVQKDLYGDLDDAPKFDEINSRAYLSLILTHTRINADTKKFITNGAIWLDEEAVKLYKKTYILLGYEERHKTLKSASEYRWGNKWIYEMLTFVYEATLGDTIYAINKNESGWKWLGHASGLPRPKEPLL